MQGAAPRPGSEGSTRGVRARLKVSKNSRTPQFILIPLEPGPAGPQKLRMAATRAQGIPSPALLPLFHPSAPTPPHPAVPSADLPGGRSFPHLPFPTALGQLGPCRLQGLGQFQQHFGCSTRSGSAAVPDAVALYPRVRGTDEPTRGSMTPPLCQRPHLNIFGCFSAVVFCSWDPAPLHQFFINSPSSSVFVPKLS